MKNPIVLLLLCLMLPGLVPVLGQTCIKAYDADTGQEITTFCAGQRVRLKSCNPASQPDKEYYDFDKSTGQVQFPDTVKFHTYTTPGTYTVTQLINTGTGPDGIYQGEKTFTVLPAPDPRFTVTSCGLGNVKVTIRDQNYDSFQVDFGGGTTVTLSRGGSASHQFGPGQAMRVEVTARYSQALCTKSADTTVQELPPPQIPILSKVQVLLPDINGRIAFTLDQLQASYYYLLEQQSGAGFTVLDTIKNPAEAQMSKVLNQVNARDQACYRIRVTDRCGTTLNALSNTVCSLPLLVSAAQEIMLSWPPYRDPAQLTGYQLFRDGQLYRSLPANQNAFTDERVTCQQQHCYELIALLGNSTRSVSNNPCITVSTSRPPAVPYLTSTFTPDNQILVAVQVPAGQAISQVTFQMSIDNSTFNDLATTKLPSYEDNTFKPNQVYCYQAQYQDSCSQTSPLSNQTCPIFLKATQGDNNTIDLNWTTYVGFSGALQYTLLRLDADGNVLASIPANGNSYTDTFTPGTSQRVFYRVQAQVNGQEPTYSNTEGVAFESKALIPTAFTPNGDNLNDVFEVKGRFIAVTRMTIYDRWGQIIYQSQGPGWDGRINGKPAPVGTYPYSISWKDENGRENARNGTVSLLK